MILGVREVRKVRCLEIWNPSVLIWEQEAAEGGLLAKTQKYFYYDYGAAGETRSHGKPVGEASEDEEYLAYQEMVRTARISPTYRLRRTILSRFG